MKNKCHIGVENIVRKGEVACYKQFLLFRQCFPQLYTVSLVCQNVALCGNGFTLYQSHALMTLTNRPYENIVGTGENAGNQHFLLFPQCFLTFQRLNSSFEPQLTHCHTITPFESPGKQTF